MTITRFGCAVRRVLTPAADRFAGGRTRMENDAGVRSSQRERALPHGER
ncbi:hypothetical protein [Longimicrobium terrae]|uniref:Uncharacterized protein n=1 Tax=Longimicrobium terrae TaxID=1639882 RepID=A0A841H397_9BACT|nr:hypothetical protein [Longimicrobium terrae]MBB4638102.1 hypothetical protein [Longimicrobium terrae]MBB6072474.1 hypothetical protein [Longimicrobium terrae]NNC32115.1 hypothetical protein [Longimicrobium terrae]